MSEKAQRHLNENSWCERETCPIENVRKHIAEQAVEIAEQESEERHAKELQELRDNAVEAYKKCCPLIGSTNNCTKGDTDCDWECLVRIANLFHNSPKN